MKFTEEDKKLIQEAINEKVILLYEKELISSLRSIMYGDIPASIAVLSFPVRNGYCYPTSVLLTKGMKKYKLVHGDVNTYPKNSEYPNHSWVERDGYVYDPTDGCKYEKELYYSLNEAEVLEVYDEKSVQNYWYYQEVSARLNSKEISPDSMAMALQYLEMLELEDNTINHSVLLEEIKICRELYGATKIYPPKVMQKYRKFMNENLDK